MRGLNRRERVHLKRCRYLLPRNPWNLSGSEQDRLSSLIRWNSPLIRAAQAQARLRKCRQACPAGNRSKSGLDCPAALQRALEGMNNRVKLVPPRVWIPQRHRLHHCHYQYQHWIGRTSMNSFYSKLKPDFSARPLARAFMLDELARGLVINGLAKPLKALDTWPPRFHRKFSCPGFDKTGSM